MELIGKIIYLVLLTMTAFYSFYNIKDFGKSWLAWTIFIFKGIWNFMKWIYKKIIP